MCPLCISSTALLMAGTATTGGITALAVRIVRGVLGASSTDRAVRQQKQEVENAPQHTGELFPVHAKGERS
jgi:hypothetical protein